MNSLTNASEMFSESILEFQKACIEGIRARYNFQKISETYKSIVDRNFSGRFCTDGHCKTIFMIEIKYDDSKWGATPKIFSSKEEAEKEVETLRLKYPFVSEFKIITRKTGEEG